MTVVVGTAGHIDHGKTSLLRVLTGIDADRLPEERRRGMTIDVGYAHLRLPDGTALDFVDVPGHDRLVGNMLVGAGEIDAALVVVAADDGPRAQTLEHLELLDALGIQDGIAVVTKADLAGPERTAVVVAAVQALIERTTLSRCPVVAVSSTSGTGIDELRVALVELRDRVLATAGLDPAGPSARPSAAGAVGGAFPGAPPGVRLAVDRVFSVKGRGVVVTGSHRGGRLERGATLRLEPGGRPVRARELQVHGETVTAVESGGRVALNLAGLEAADVARGAVLATDRAVRSTDRLLVLIRPPAHLDDRARSATWPLSPGTVVRLHSGTASVDATIRRGQRDSAVLPDGLRVATLGLVHPIALGAGDRFVLRVPSPGATAAGGIVLDVAPPSGPSRRRVTPDLLVALATAVRGGDGAAELAARVALHGIVERPERPERPDGPAPDPPDGARVLGPWLVAEPIVTRLDEEALALVAAHHEAAPLAVGAPLADLRRTLARLLRRQATVAEPAAAAIVGTLLDALVAGGRLARAGSLIRSPGRAAGGLPPAVLAAIDRLEAALAVPAPPPLSEAARGAECPSEGIRALEAAGRIVVLEPDLAWAASTHRELEALALGLATPGPLTPAALRDATGTSRKYVMVLLDDLDRRGVLRRTPDGHVRGPRAPR
jgi:selenocysteine-specific elongation factor